MCFRTVSAACSIESARLEPCLCCSRAEGSAAIESATVLDYFAQLIQRYSGLKRGPVSINLVSYLSAANSTFGLAKTANSVLSGSGPGSEASASAAACSSTCSDWSIGDSFLVSSAGIAAAACSAIAKTNWHSVN